MHIESQKCANVPFSETSKLSTWCEFALFFDRDKLAFSFLEHKKIIYFKVNIIKLNFCWHSITSSPSNSGSFVVSL